jgi:hypothetical protein
MRTLVVEQLLASITESGSGRTDSKFAQGIFLSDGIINRENALVKLCCLLRLSGDIERVSKLNHIALLYSRFSKHGEVLLGRVKFY